MAITAAPGSTRTRRPIRSCRVRATGVRPSKPGRISANATAFRSLCCGSPAFTDRVATRSPRFRAGTPAASSSRARCSPASMSTTLRRRSTPRWRSGPTVFSTSPTTTRRLPAIQLTFAAGLLGVPPPPEIPYEQAAQSMSPMAKSFWQECRRVTNDKLKRELGVTLRYPTYREGLNALLEEQKRAR